MVIAVMAILAAFAVPALWWIAGTRTGGAARVLVMDLTHARESAMQSGTPCWVVFDVPASSYRLLAEDPDTPGLDNAQYVQDRGTGAAYEQQFGAAEFRGTSIISVSFDGAAEVSFDWLGRPGRADGQAMEEPGLVVLSHGFECVLEPETGLSWANTPQ